MDHMVNITSSPESSTPDFSNLSANELDALAIDILFSASDDKNIMKQIRAAMKLTGGDLEIAGITFKTSSYGLFAQLPGNREITELNLRKLEKSILDNGFRISSPIIVNIIGNVLNGQHRLAICAEHCIPAYFTIDTDMETSEESLKLTVDMNMNQKTWTLLDYVKSYAQREFQDYKLLLSLVQDENISLSLALWMLYHSRNGDIQESVRAGALRCSQRDVTSIKKSLEFLKEIRDVIPEGLPSNRQLRTAILTDKLAVPLLTIFEQPQYNHSRMLKQVRAYHFNIDKRTMFAAGESFVDIYNYRLKDAVRRIRPYREISSVVA